MILPDVTPKNLLFTEAGVLLRGLQLSLRSKWELYKYSVREHAVSYCHVNSVQHKHIGTLR